MTNFRALRPNSRVESGRDVNELWGADWPEVRKRWYLDPKSFHLNHGSYGAVPVKVLSAQAALKARMEVNPTNFFNRELPELHYRARVKAAQFLKVSESGFAFVPNTTTGVNIALNSIRLRRGDEILTTDHTYGAVLIAAGVAAKRTGARVVKVRIGLDISDPRDVIDQIKSGVTQNTKVAIVDHVSSQGALVFPVEEVIKDLSDEGVRTIVDGAHATGMVPLDISRLGADFWIGNFHKWVCAPRGSAGLYVSERMRRRVTPLVPSWNFGLGFPLSFSWLGTNDHSSYLSVPSAVQFLRELGISKLRKHNSELARYGASVTASSLGLSPPDLPRSMLGWMRLVPLPRETDPDLLVDLVKQRLGIEIMAYRWNRKPWLRLSAHAYNAPYQYDLLAEGIPRLTRLARGPVLGHENQATSN